MLSTLISLLVLLINWWPSSLYWKRWRMSAGAYQTVDALYYILLILPEAPGNISGSGTSRQSDRPWWFGQPFRTHCHAGCGHIPPESFFSL